MGKLPHKAAQYLDQLHRQGASVVFKTEQWTAERLDECLQRGSHSSADDHVDFVRDEMAEFVSQGFWTVLPFRLVKNLRHLRLSPLGVVPQRDRRPRLIVDLSFYGVNDETVKLAPPGSMQFGRALDRILHKIRHSNPKFGPVYLLKIDISDGFYRVGLAPSTAPGLGVVLPQAPNEQETLVAIPLSLPMGWVESPPVFCAVTETATDLANSMLERPTAPRHRLEKQAATMPPVVASAPLSDPVVDARHSSPHRPLPPHRTMQPAPRPVGYVDVYVDDFIGAAQGSRQRLLRIKRHLLHSIDAVFATSADVPGRKEASSVKKLLKGDGSWQTQKVVLGWLIDTIRQTIALPAHRAARLLEIFDRLRGKTRLALKKWQQILGELRSMVLAIPGGRGLFSVLQHGVKMRERNRVTITPSMRDQLDDFEALAQALAERPTRLAEIVPDLPAAIGACDASKLGMGGVWFLPNGECLVWRHTFPPSIQQRMVSSSNMTGDLTNSDFELAGVVAHQDVLAQHVDLRERTIAVLNDNTPAISRCTKGSVSSDSAAAYLLRINSLNQRFHRFLGRYHHISGLANAMADDSSRLFHLTDSLFHSRFQQSYPQEKRWRMCYLRPEMNLALISALQKRRVEPRSFLSEPTHKIGLGRFGKVSAWSSASPLSSITSMTPSPSSKSLPNATGMADSPRARTVSDLVPWSKPFVTSARRWPNWGPLIPV